MKRADLLFDRPKELAATHPARISGRARDAGRLLVSTAGGHRHARFFELAKFFQPGDLLVVNCSATLPASLPAEGEIGSFTLNLSTNYGDGLWLAEPRRSPAQPGPLPGISAGQKLRVAGCPARLVAPFPGLNRLWFVRFQGDAFELMERAGSPIRYGYLNRAYDLKHYQTIFATVPGSAEMPSAAYPFTQRVVQELLGRGVRIASILLHTGVSSLEVEVDDIEEHPLYPEPYAVPAATAEAVNAARAEGRRVIAAGTTVIRALESAWDGQNLHASSGFTRMYIHPRSGIRAGSDIRAESDIHVADGLLTGLHDPATSHLAMLYAIAGKEMVQEGYSEAIREGYRWHEFGDSHLLLPGASRLPHIIHKPDIHNRAISLYNRKGTAVGTAINWIDYASQTHH